MKNKYWGEVVYHILIAIVASMLGIVVGLLFVKIAHAEQVSIICKTHETKEIIDIVAKGNKTSEVLVQFNGGKFFDGFSSFDEPLFKVVVPFDEGSAMIVYNVETQKGGFMLTSAKDRQFHEISCMFR